MANNRLPTFLFIGPGKTGSTWIFKALDAHPEVFVPTAKELYFFSENYHKGLSWYAAFFENSGEKKAIGELTPNYLFSREVAERIAKDLPHIKLFTCIRNPIDRAVSDFQFKKRNGLVKSDIFEAIQKYPEMLEPGKYVKYLQPYIDTFGSENFKIFVFDDLKTDPKLFAKQIYQFIGVNPEFEYLDANNKVLSASEPKSAILAKFVYKMSQIAQRFGWVGLLGRVRNSFVTKLLYKPAEKEKLTPEQKTWLINYYREDVEKLEKLLNRNFQRWLQ